MTKNRVCHAACGACVIKNDIENWGISTLGNTNTRSLSTIVEMAAADDTPVFIINDDIDYEGARSSSLSNKIFAAIDYSWLHHTAIPSIGLGGEVELGSNSNCCSPKKSCCRKASLSQWGVWLKGSVSF